MGRSFKADESPRPHKPELPSDHLESNGIYYYENVFTGNSTDDAGHNDMSTFQSSSSTRTITRVPDDVYVLRERLLDFRQTIPRDRDMLLLFSEDSERGGIPDDAAKWTTEFQLLTSSEQLKAAGQKREIKCCQDMAAIFEELERECEAKWVQELLKHLFKEYKDARPEDVRQKDECVYERWHIAQGLHWNELPDLQDNAKTKIPYPDLTYGFPLHNTTDLKKAQLVHGSLESDGVANFTLAWHRELRKEGMITCPSKSLSTDDKKSSYVRKDQRICFPWAIVEVKRDEDLQQSARAIEKKCYSQAANGAAAALALQQPFRKELWGPNGVYLYPVIAFTCIGPLVKTWLAYRSYDGNVTSTDMVCIYEANIATVWGAYCMHLIVKNMHAYVLRVLRPRMIDRLSRHRKKGQYTALRLPIPLSPVATTFSIPENLGSQTEHAPRGRSLLEKGHRTASESPIALRDRREASVPRVEAQLVSLSISDDEGPTKLQRDVAEDSGVGGMSSDNDSDCSDSSYPDWSKEDDGRIAERIVCREIDPQRGYPDGRGYYLVKYRDSRGNRWLAARRVTMYHAGLKDKYLARMRRR